MKNTTNAISFDVTTFEAAKDWIFLPGVYNGWGDSNEKEEWKVWETDGGNKKYRTLVCPSSGSLRNNHCRKKHNETDD
jgi:hypothetical protein